MIKKSLEVYLPFFWSFPVQLSQMHIAIAHIPSAGFAEQNGRSKTHLRPPEGAKCKKY